MFKTQFTNLQQPTYESDSELDIFHTCDSQNLSCSNYANLTYKEIKKIIKINKVEKKRIKLFKKQSKAEQKAEQKQKEKKHFPEQI